MLILTEDITLLEVPGEVSISFSVYGCTLSCPGCSWAGNGYTPYELTMDDYLRSLNEKRGLATCVLFLGGCWDSDFTKYLEEAVLRGFKTCLYTGHVDVSENVTQHLTYLKTGPYIEALGGLTSPTTNQKFINVKTGECLNHLFQRKQRRST